MALKGRRCACHAALLITQRLHEASFQMFSRTLLLLLVPLVASDLTDPLQEFHRPPGRNSHIIRPSSFVASNYKRGNPIARLSSSKAAPPLDSSRPLPCCKDESGGAICRAIKANDPRSFANKCMTEPDFSLVVCCKACDDAGSTYRDRATNFFSPSNNSTNCFDRMSSSYCSRFQTNADAWSGKRWSCHSEHYRLGFRVCRSTCGFCQIDWKNAPEPTKCN